MIVVTDDRSLDASPSLPFPSQNPGTPLSARNNGVETLRISTAADSSAGEGLDAWKEKLDKEIQLLDRVLERQMTPIDLMPEDGVGVGVGVAGTGSKAQTATTTTSPIKARSLAPGWTIRISESGNNKDNTQTDYKTFFVHQNATALEVLVHALKKWRYLSSQFSVVEDSLKHTVEREGWQILYLSKQEQQAALRLLSYDQQLVNVLPSTEGLAEDFKAHFVFRKNPNSLLSPREESSTKSPTTATSGPSLTPVHVYKLDSTYNVERIEATAKANATATTIDIDSKHWSRRHVVLAKGRYLLFFKSEHHSSWAQNILNEIDMSKVTAVERAPVIRITKKEGSSGVVTTVSSFAFLLRTRTRSIYLSCDTEPIVATLLHELNELRHHLNMIRKPSPSAKTTPLFVHMESNVSHATIEDRSPVDPTPLEKIIEHLVISKRINDTDLLLVRNQDTLVAVRTIQQTLRAFAITRLVHLLSERDVIMPVNELLPLFRDGLMEDAVTALEKQQHGHHHRTEETTGVLTSMKKLFRNFGGSQTLTTETALTGVATANAPIRASSSGAGLDGKGSTISLPLLGVALEELSCRYDTTGTGAPCVPPIVSLSIQYLLQNGLHTQGLFRLAGNVKRVDQLKHQWEEDEVESVAAARRRANEPTSTSAVRMDFSAFNVHDVASVLKQFFRDLPEPLLPYRLYPVFLALESKFHEETTIWAHPVSLPAFVAHSLPAPSRPHLHDRHTLSRRRAPPPFNRDPG